MDVEKWLIIPLLYALPAGVFYLGITSPEHRPAAIQFASVAFGASLTLLGSRLAVNLQGKKAAAKPLITPDTKPIDHITKIQ